MRLSQASLEYALRRLEDFHQVHINKTSDQLMEPLAILLESLGFDEERVDELDEWLGNFGGEGVEEAVMLGLIIGLISSQYDT